MQAAHGYPVLLAETFVDPARFAGTCYRASNWRSLGLTRGFAREPGGPARWRRHGQPKEIFVFELTAGAAEALSQNEIPADWSAEPHSKPMAAPRLRSLFECLGEVPSAASGGASAIAEDRSGACRRGPARRLPRRDRVCSVRRPAHPGAAQGGGRVLQREQTAPYRAVDHYLPQHPRRLPPETLDNAIGQWTGQHGPAHAPVAMDGKICAALRSRPRRGAG